MKILLTGSEGGIGRHLVARLQSQGHEVRGLDLKETASADYEYTSGDLRDFATVLRVADGADAVIHAGAIPCDVDGKEDAVLATNAQGTGNVLLACVRHDIPRVVHFSSVNALGVVGGLRQPTQFPVRDDYPHHPLTPYQIGKHLAEETCRAFSDRWGIVTVSLRPMWVMSPEHRRWWRAQPTEARRPGALGGTLSEWVALEDVGEATVRSLHAENVRHDAFLLSAPTTLWDVPTLDVIHERFADVPWPDTTPNAWTADNPFRSFFDCFHARQVLNWTPRIEWRDET